MESLLTNPWITTINTKHPVTHLPTTIINNTRPTIILNNPMDLTALLIQND